MLTVKAGEINSHAKYGWQEFTKKALELLFKDPKPKVFIAWGAQAEAVLGELSFLSQAPHLILEAGHPASASYGVDKFSGCNHFSKTNRFLKNNNLQPINWVLHE